MRAQEAYSQRCALQKDVEAAINRMLEVLSNYYGQWRRTSEQPNYLLIVKVDIATDAVDTFMAMLDNQLTRGLIRNFDIHNSRQHPEGRTTVDIKFWPAELRF